MKTPKKKLDIEYDPNLNVPGLKLRCTHPDCDTWIYGTCRSNNRPIKECAHPERVEYISAIHIPGTKNSRRILVHKSNTLKDIIPTHFKFKEEVQKGIAPKTAATRKPEPAPKENQPTLLVDYAARFLSYMKDENVPSHLHKNLDPHYLKAVEREMKLLCECLATKGVQLSSFAVEDIDDTTVGFVCDYLKDVKTYSNRSFNKHINTYASFYSWWLGKERRNGENFFSKVRRKRVDSQPQTIESREEFEALLKQITPENGRQTAIGKKKANRNIYRPWLVAAYRLALETGSRREELITMKLSDVIEDKSGPIILRVENIKVNNIMRFEGSQKRYIPLPVTENLKALLMELGYGEYKRTGADHYLIAPDITEKREVMLDALTRAFSHYHKQLGTGKELQFGALRKAYISQMEVYTGGKAESITGHSNEQVLRHYVVPEVVAKAARGFQVFPEEKKQQKELQRSRDKSISKQKTIER